LMCSAVILVVPVARPLHSLPTTTLSSESVEAASGTAEGSTFNCIAHPRGGTAVYSWIFLSVCLANVYGHGFGARSSTEQYHPFRWRQASMYSPAARQPLTFEAVVAAHCRRLAFKHTLIFCPRLRAAVWESMPFQPSIAR
jgi:hypothetical protein